MALHLENLDSETRGYMLQEINQDIVAGTLYMSPRLNSHGVQNYPALISEAAEKQNDAWLASALCDKFNAYETRNLRGKTIEAKVPVNASEMLAEGEFNRFYLRGLCIRAIQAGIPSLTICRAKAVSNPRHESEAKIGTFVTPATLLNDLRANIGIDTALGLPAGPNSGLTAKLS
jgi:hypothetical protein